MRRVALAAGLCAVAVSASAPQAHGVAKVGLGVAANIKSPSPRDANMWLGVVGQAIPGGNKIQSSAAPKVRVKSGRRKGVVVVYGLKRLEGKKPRYQLIVFAIRGADQPQTSKAAKSGNEVAIETLERTGGRNLELKRTDAINSVVGSNREPKHKMLDLSDFKFGTIGGALSADQRTAESKARHDIALNAFLVRYAYRQAFDLTDDPDDEEFLRVLGDCCQAK